MEYTQLLLRAVAVLHGDTALKSGCNYGEWDIGKTK